MDIKTLGAQKQILKFIQEYYNKQQQLSSFQYQNEEKNNNGNSNNHSSYSSSSHSSFDDCEVMVISPTQSPVKTFPPPQDQIITTKVINKSKPSSSSFSSPFISAPVLPTILSHNKMPPSIPSNNTINTNLIESIDDDDDEDEFLDDDDQPIITHQKKKIIKTTTKNKRLSSKTEK